MSYRQTKIVLNPKSKNNFKSDDIFQRYLFKIRFGEYISINITLTKSQPHSRQNAAVSITITKIFFNQNAFCISFIFPRISTESSTIRGISGVGTAS